MNIQLPAKLKFLWEPMRYKVAYGGRGGAKSHAFARALVAQGMLKPERVLCTREVQKSIKDSVHRLLSDLIIELGMDSFYSITQYEIRGKNGTLFLFAGLSDQTAMSVKSFEGVTKCWVEEAQTVSDRSWEILIPTIRAPGSEIWVSFNPDEESDPTFQRFCINTPPNCRVVKINWDDNPWFPDELRQEKDYLYSIDPEVAAHVWGGECRKASDAQVLRGRCSVEHFEVKPHWDGPYQGVDWGFANDPTTFMRVWIDGRTLYVEKELYGIGWDIDLLPSYFDDMPDGRQHVTRADNARPETISYMVRQGWKNMMAADKWPGSVEDGVEFLRMFEKIVIHPDCKHCAEEARLWSYAVDRLTGNVLPKLVDKYNHTWDAIRYALAPMIRGRNKPTEETPCPFGRSYTSSWMA